MVKLLLAFVMAGILLLCAVYCTLAYYRLVSIAKTNLTIRLDSFGTSYRLKPKIEKGYLVER